MASPTIASVQKKDAIALERLQALIRSEVRWLILLNSVFVSHSLPGLELRGPAFLRSSHLRNDCENGVISIGSD